MKLTAIIFALAVYFAGCLIATSALIYRLEREWLTYGEDQIRADEACLAVILWPLVLWRTK